jgi:hypothetical protein
MKRRWLFCIEMFLLLVSVLGLSYFAFNEITGMFHFDFIFQESQNNQLTISQNDNCLCIYNNNSKLSKDICDYYALKRPGVNVFGLDIPEDKFLYGDKEKMSIENFKIFVKQPVLRWIEEHKELKITHLAVAKDIPININGKSSGQYLALKVNSSEDDLATYSNEYSKKLEPFNPSDYKNINFVVSFLTGYSLDDIKKMIDKAVSPVNNLANLKFVVDRDADRIMFRTNENYSTFLNCPYVINNSVYYVGGIPGMGGYFVMPYTPISPLNKIIFYWNDNLPPAFGVLERYGDLGQDYIFNVSMPFVYHISDKAVYSNNGQNFVFYRAHNNSMSFFGKIVLNNPNGDFPPENSGKLVKVSGEGPDEIIFTKSKKIDNQINYSSWYSGGHSLDIYNLQKAETFLLNSGIKSESIILEDTNNRPLIYDGEIVAYEGSGAYHSNYNGGLWITSGNFNFSVSNRSILTSYESFNGITFTGNYSHPDYMPQAWQGKIADAIVDVAFGGNNYSRSFSGAIGYVEEPGTEVCHADIMMSGYVNGLTLAETSMACWNYLWTSNLRGTLDYNARGIAIGDPLMRINDNMKQGVGMFCNENSDCFAGFCNYDRNWTKRCHANKDNCVNGASGEISGFSLENLETTNNNIYCFNSIDYRKCEDGNWQNSENCGKNNFCYYDSLSGLSECKHKIQGSACEKNEDCSYGLFSGKCDEDLEGIKRCHFDSKGCIANEDGIEVSSNDYVCTDDKHRKKCLSNIWQDETLCENGCENGICKIVGNYINYTILLEKNNSYYLSLPLEPESKLINNIFKNYLIGDKEDKLSDKINLFNSSSGSWNLYFKSGDFEFPNDFFSNKILSTPNSVSDAQLNPGEGFVIRTSFAGDNRTIVFFGRKVNSPVRVSIKNKLSLIGIPYCYESYTASKIISEINNLDKSCLTIKRYNSLSKKFDWFSLNATYSLGLSDGIKADFNITNYESYFVSCSSSVDIKYKPNCNGFYDFNMLNVSNGENSSMIVLGDKIIFKINNPEKENINLSEITLIKRIVNNKSYLVIKDINISEKQTKIIYLEKTNNNSNAICFVDEEVKDIDSIGESCIKMKCPGNLLNYTCEIENETLIISGLKYSGVVEDILYCGDNICYSDEFCSNCPGDCGACSGSPGSGGGGGSSGSGGGNSGSIKTTLNNTQVNTTVKSNQTIPIMINITSHGTENNSHNSKFIIILISVLGFIILIVYFFIYYLNSDSRKINKIYKLIKEGREALSLGGLENIKIARGKYNQCKVLFGGLKNKTIYLELMSFYKEFNKK